MYLNDTWSHEKGAITSRTLSRGSQEKEEIWWGIAENRNNHPPYEKRRIEKPSNKALAKQISLEFSRICFRVQITNIETPDNQFSRWFGNSRWPSPYKMFPDPQNIRERVKHVGRYFGYSSHSFFSLERKRSAVFNFASPGVLSWRPFVRSWSSKPRFLEKSSHNKILILNTWHVITM